MSPGAADHALIRRHLLALDRSVQQLKRHAGQPIDKLSDLDEAWVVERGLQLCAQNVVYVATHLVSAAGVDAPDYAGAIDGLAQIGVLPRDFATRIRGVAGFRNVLVHAYLDVDRSLVHRLLNERLVDFSEFAAHIEAYLAR